MTLTTSPFLLRPMDLPDLVQITAIEAESFPSAWPSNAYKRELQRNNLARYIVAVERAPAPPPATGLRHLVDGIWRAFGGEATPPGERIAGFLGLWYMVDETHIVTVATRAAERRRGVGELLLLGAFDLTAARGIPRLTLECRVSNEAALALYDKYGFERLGIRKRYYTDNNEDAVIMTTASLDDPAYRARIEDLRRRHQERWGAAAIQHPDL